MHNVCQDLIRNNPWENENFLSEGVTIVVGIVDSLSEELVSYVVGMDGGITS